jgi:hypothetical protein
VFAAARRALFCLPVRLSPFAFRLSPFAFRFFSFCLLPFAFSVQASVLALGLIEDCRQLFLARAVFA